MATKKGGGKFRRYIRGSVDEQLDLSTLAPKTLISTAFDNTVVDTTRISSIVASWSISEWTAAAGDGPVLVGVAHSDYTDAEIEEVIENSGSWDEGNLVSREINKRMVRKIGQFIAPTAAILFDRLNEGKPVKTKLNWLLSPGDTLRLWAYNMGASAFATTNPEVQVEGHANLWPQ